MSEPRTIGEVVTFPARRAAGGATRVLETAASLAAGVDVALMGQMRQWSSNTVDDWGRDNEYVDRIWAMSHLRWHISVGGFGQLPTNGGALIVVNARRYALAPIFAALAIGAKIDRPVRFVGRPDVTPVGPLMQRLGGLLPIVDEVEGVLRAGQVVVMGADHVATNQRVGKIDHRLVGAAVAAKVDVFPAATASAPTRRGARVDIGAPVRLRRRRRGPLRELELADEVKVRIDALLEEFGGVMTGTPLDWLPISGIGGL